MRILTVQPGFDFSVADVHRGWCRAFEQLGCQVIDFNLNDRLTFYAAAHLEQNGRMRHAMNAEQAARLAIKGLQAVAYEAWPDLIFVTSGFFVPPAMYQLFNQRGHKVVLNQLESPYEDNRQMTMAALVDVALINDPTNLESFKAVNPKTYYMPAAYDPDIHAPGPPVDDLASDFCFVGTGFPSRIEFLEQIDWDGIDVALAGNWQATGEDSPLRKFVAHDLDHCCDNTDTVNLYRSTKVSANLYRQETEESGSADGWAMGPRELELAATGTFFLRSPRGESDEVLCMLPTFDGPGDFEEKLRYWLADEDGRVEVAAAARAAISQRTFINNARALLRLLAD